MFPGTVWCSLHLVGNVGEKTSESTIFSAESCQYPIPIPNYQNPKLLITVIDLYRMFPKIGIPQNG